MTAKPPDDLPSAKVEHSTSRRELLLGVKERVERDNVALVSAGIAFYGLLALFPGTAVLVSLYGLFADPADITTHVSAFPGLPDAAKEVVTEHLHSLAQSSQAALSLGFAGALSFSLWSTSRATKALLIAVNIAFDQDETRGFFHQNTAAVLVTAALLVTVTAGLLIIAVLPSWLRHLGLPVLPALLAQTLPWLLLLGGAVLGLSLLYRHGPHGHTSTWRWVTPGAVAATFLWFLSSLGFSAYVANFGSYNETYGAVGAVVVLLLWFWMSAFVVILGVELDAQLEELPGA